MRWYYAILKVESTMSLATDPVINFDDVHFSINDHPIFKGLSLSIPAGKITAVMGPSGTGKTTLLKLIGGQIQPDSGRITVGDYDLTHRLSSRELQELRRQTGRLFQQGALFTDLSVFDNVAFPLREHLHLPTEIIRDLVLMKLQAVGLRGAAKMEISELSGGMARRVAIARAIIMDPKLMLYDEPFTGQDPIGRGVLLKLMQQLNDALDLTTVLVSHDIREASAIADYVYVIAEGKVAGHGEPDAIEHHKDPFIRQFVRGEPGGEEQFHYPAKDYKQDLDL